MYMSVVVVQICTRPGITLSEISLLKKLIAGL